MDCIFCKIINGEIPIKKIMETKKSLAFLDAFPVTKGHSLVIPKTHYEKVQNMTLEDYTDLFEAVRQVISKINNISNAELLAIHNGKESGQEIPHVHVHIIPRSKKDSAGAVHSMFKNRPTLSEQEFNELFKQIKD